MILIFSLKGGKKEHEINFLQFISRIIKQKESLNMNDSEKTVMTQFKQTVIVPLGIIMTKPVLISVENSCKDKKINSINQFFEPFTKFLFHAEGITQDLVQNTKRPMNNTNLHQYGLLGSAKEIQWENNDTDSTNDLMN